MKKSELLKLLKKKDEELTELLNEISKLKDELKELKDKNTNNTLLNEILEVKKLLKRQIR